LCSPIIVNQEAYVIDGQHRLLAAKEADLYVYYIVVDGYNLNDVHTLNLNQKNWSRNDFLDGYANMGIESYVKLKKFMEDNTQYSINAAIGLCSQLSTGSAYRQRVKPNGELSSTTQIFEEGTWLGGDFDLAQEWADKFSLLSSYYDKYNSMSFTMCMITMMKNSNFDFNEFLHKVRIQPTALVDCANQRQYTSLIEDIYNYKRRDKVNLRY